ncbi:hypothetical protein [Burkholderia ubonensis]|uniref:hypothetical protein n=1 Tax=Burkholderia ubonensis TaxID=101571 RepID=UPI0009B4697E|nr:hypothetical protein [Burkholderia ubonensis]
MKRNLLVVTLLAALVASPVYAGQEPDASSAAANTQDSLISHQEFKMPAGPARVRRTILTTDPDDPHKTVTIDQVLTRTGPNKLTFVRGEQPADATFHRQKLCKRMGGIDVTNDSEITINDQILNFSLCKNVAQQPVANKNSAEFKANDLGMTIIVPAITAKHLEQSYLPMYVWTSTTYPGDVNITMLSGVTGYLYIKAYAYAGVNNLQPVFSFRPFLLGTFPVTTTACHQQLGCHEDKRGLITVVQ